MKRFFQIAVSLLALTCLAAAAQQAKPEEKADAKRTLKLKLNYTGAGKVGSKHQIFIFLFDTPDFVSGNVMPIGSKAGSAKDDLVAFEDLTTSPIYAVAAFDPAGNYDGQSGPPPSGSSLGIYSTTPGQPGPIKIDAGKTAQVELTFDDTAKMP